MAITNIQYVGGYGKPKFEAYNADLTIKIGEIILPQTLLPDGLQEIWQEESVAYRKLTKINVANPTIRIVKKPLGWRPIFTFDYSTWINNDTFINKVKVIQNWEDDGLRIFLTPHIDYPEGDGRFEVVKPEESEIQWGMLQEGGFANTSPGNNGVYLSYVSVHLVKYFNPRDPNAIQYNSMFFGMLTT